MYTLTLTLQFTMQFQRDFLRQFKNIKFLRTMLFECFLSKPVKTQCCYMVLYGFQSKPAGNQCKTIKLSWKHFCCSLHA